MWTWFLSRCPLKLPCQGESQWKECVTQTTVLFCQRTMDEFRKDHPAASEIEVVLAGIVMQLGVTLI